MHIISARAAEKFILLLRAKLGFFAMHQIRIRDRVRSIRNFAVSSPYTKCKTHLGYFSRFNEKTVGNVAMAFPLPTDFHDERTPSFFTVLVSTICDDLKILGH